MASNNDEIARKKRSMEVDTVESQKIKRHKQDHNGRTRASNEDRDTLEEKLGFPYILSLFVSAAQGYYNPKRQQDEDSLLQCLPIQIIQIILSTVPLQKVFHVLSISDLRDDVWASPEFHKMWDERNKETFLVINHYQTVSLFNTTNPQWLSNILHGWITCIAGILKAAAAGFLVFLSRKDGMLHIVNPLTVKFHHVPDFTVNKKYGLSHYLKKLRHEEIGVEIIVDSSTMSCQVIVFGNFTRNKLHFYIYRLAEKSWEMKIPENSICLKKYPKRVLCNQTIYFFFKNGFAWAAYSLCGENRLRIVRHSIRGFNEKALNYGIVGYRGRIIQFQLLSPETFIILELDESAPMLPTWRSFLRVCNGQPDHSLRLPDKFTVNSGDGDCIFVAFAASAFTAKILSIDLDAGLVKLMTWQSKFNVIDENSQIFSMPLKFCPLSSEF